MIISISDRLLIKNGRAEALKGGIGKSTLWLDLNIYITDDLFLIQYAIRLFSGVWCQVGSERAAIGG